MAESDISPRDRDYRPQVPKPNTARFTGKLSTPKYPEFHSGSLPPSSTGYIHSHRETIPFDDTLRKHLTGNTLNTNNDFLEQLLPREILPFPINANLLSKLSVPIGVNPPLWNERKSCFCQPPTHFGEAAICEWLNNIGTTMGLVYSRPCERLWWSGCCGSPLVDSSIQRRPDLILLDRSYYERVLQDSAGAEWTFVKAIGVLHRPYMANDRDSINIKSYLTFLRQPHRRFTISLSFFNVNNGQFSITVTDRAGRIRINKIDLMGDSVENGLLLLSTLAILMFGSPADIGLDPHFEINPLNGQVTAIQCESRRFEVVGRIHASPSLFGRGTQVWIVVHQGIKYVLKDSWVREDCVHNEVVYLRKMKPFKDLDDRVPTLLCGGEVIINGREDSTRHYRSARSSHRIHRRTVTSPVGESIMSFKSKKEFIRALMSVIETHHYLFNHVGILHSDLSLNNIMLNRKDNGSEAFGLLIDYDYSVSVDGWNQRPRISRSSSNASYPCSVTIEKTSTCEKATDRPKAQSWSPRTGTPPYMAIEALLTANGTFIHKPRHDLESILYIIIIISTFVWGPGLPIYRREASLPIRTWFCGDNTKAIGSRKLANLQDYDVAILPYFTPYWHDFIPFVKDLITTCFPVSVHLPNEFQYEQVLGILKDAARIQHC